MVNEVIVQTLMESRTDNLVRDGVVETFWTEFMAYWRLFPNRGLFLILLGAWLMLFQFFGNGVRGYFDTPSIYVWMFRTYNGGSVTDDSHGNLVPFVVLSLMWWKRKELVAGALRSWTPAIGFVVFGLLLHLFGFAVQYTPTSIVGLFTGLYGLMGLAWGPGFMRAAFFPFVLFIFSVPLGRLAEPVTFNLRLAMATVVEFVARGVFGLDVVRQGTGLFDPAGGFQYDVAAACSGLRSLWAMFILATAYGYVRFRASAQWVVLMLVAFPLAVIGNSCRLLLIVMAAKLVSKEMGDTVHEHWFFSLLPYVPVTIGLAWTAHLLTKFRVALANERAKGTLK